MKVYSKGNEIYVKLGVAKHSFNVTKAKTMMCRFYTALITIDKHGKQDSSGMDLVILQDINKKNLPIAIYSSDFTRDYKDENCVSSEVGGVEESIHSFVSIG